MLSTTKITFIALQVILAFCVNVNSRFQKMNEASQRIFAENAGVYTPIRSRDQSRLLEIEPGVCGQPIHTLLHIVDLRETNDAVLYRDQRRISYKALSYCWGQQVFDHTITCNDVSLSITRTLHCALQRIRERYGSCFLWVDAVCINQADLEERSGQLASMISVYTHAEEVIAWFGEKDDNVRFSLGDALSVKSTRKSRTSAENLACNPWFYRVWIRQEVWAANRITVLYGDQSCAWDELGLFPSVYHMVDPLRQQLSNLSDSFARRGRFRLDDPERDIVNILWQARLTRCTDPRDSVYALLGMTNIQVHGSEIACSHESCLTVDYNRTLSQVFQDLTIYLMKHSHSLDLLYYNAKFGKTKEVQDMPSWTPDWRYCSKPDGSQKRWHANRATFPNPCRALGNGVLELRGFRLGTIGAIFPDSYAKLRVPLTEIIALTMRAIPADFTFLETITARGSIMNQMMSKPVEGLSYFFRVQIDSELRRLGPEAVVALLERKEVEIDITDHSKNSYRAINIQITTADVEFEEECEWHPASSDKKTGLDLKYAKLEGSIIQDSLEDKWADFEEWEKDKESPAYKLAALELSSQIWSMPMKAKERHVVIVARGGTYPLILRPVGQFYEFVGHTHILVSRSKTFRDREDRDEHRKNMDPEERQRDWEEQEALEERKRSDRDQGFQRLLSDALKFNEQSTLDHLQTYCIV